MTPEEAQALRNQLADIKARLDRFEKIDHFYMTKDIETNNSVGTRIGRSGKEKWSFWGNTPVIQFATPTGRSDVSGGGGAAITAGSQYNGNTGTDYYSVGDIVYALKLCGILKNN